MPVDSAAVPAAPWSANSASSSPRRNALPPVASWQAAENCSTASGRQARTSTAAALADSGAGRTISALLASTSSRARSAPGSAGRVAPTSRTGRSSMRSARNTSHRSEAVSAQWRSSATSSSGSRDARLAANQYRPCRRANSPSASAASLCVAVNTAPAGSAPPVSRSGDSLTQRSSNCRTTPNPNERSSSEPRPRMTRRPPASAREPASRSSSVFPTPACPSTRTAPPLPMAACSTERSSRRCSSSRSRSVTLRAGPADITRRFSRRSEPMGETPSAGRVRSVLAIAGIVERAPGPQPERTIRSCQVTAPAPPRCTIDSSRRSRCGCRRRTRA